MQTGAGMFDRWSKRFAGWLEEGDLDSALDKLDTLIAEDDEFTAWFEHTSEHAWMAGQLMVRAVEATDSATAVELARATNSFVNLDFAAAIEFFAEKQVVSPAAFDAIQDRFRRGAFTARRLTQGAVRNAARSAVEGVLANNVTPRAAARLIRDGSLSIGIQPEANHYLMNVVRTNVSTAYNAGRFEAMTDPAVMDARPYWLYITARDDRVRDEHESLDGRVFAAGSEEGLAYYPPLGFQCRCSMTTMSTRQYERLGSPPVESGAVTARPGDELPTGTTVTPDAGFAGPPEPLTGS